MLSIWESSLDPTANATYIDRLIIFSFLLFCNNHYLLMLCFDRGVHMKDLISLHVALSDSLEGGLINFRKMAQLSLIFQELQELQNATPPPGANIDLVNTLRVRVVLNKDRTLKILIKRKRIKLSNLNNYFHSIDVQVSLELAYTEDEIYELSLAREPRDSLSVNIYLRHYTANPINV
jgi:hypothetical protein